MQFNNENMPNAPPNHLYPQLINPAYVPPPNQPIPSSFSNPGQVPPYPYQPGFAYAYPGQPANPNIQPGQPGAPPVPMQYPAAMSYAGVAHVPPHAQVPTAPTYAYSAGYPNITPTPVLTSPVQWIATTPSDASSLSNSAIVAGYEGYDGSPLWVIRARFHGDLIPGKLAIKHRAAYVAWGGKENDVKSIEVCCAEPNKIKWIECRDGNIPPNAVVAGNTSSGEPLYVGRAKEQGSLTPGKVHQSHKALYLSFGGKEIAHKTYEVMCTV